MYHSIYSELIPFERTVVWNSIRHTRNRRIPFKFKARGENFVFNTMGRELKIGKFNVVEHAPRRVQENVQTLRSAGKYYPLYHVTDHEVFYWLVYLEIVIFKADMITVWCGIYFNEKVFGVDKTEEGFL